MQRPEIPGSVGSTNPPPVRYGDDPLISDVPAPRREEFFPKKHIHPISAYYASFSREFRMVSAMTGMMLLVLGTYCSVSRYQMSAQVSQLLLGSILIVYVSTLLVAVRCRGRHGESRTAG